MKVRLPGKVLREFYRDRSYFSGILGPVGSGKSSTCVLKMLAVACEQEPDTEGVRRTEWLVVRRTHSELRTTTIPTFLQWMRDHCEMRWSPPFEAVSEFPLADGTRVSMKVTFLPLDRADTLDKVRSMNITGAWINEARELSKDVVDAVMERCGRFPIGPGLPGPTWYGCIADTNAPTEDHWWPILAGEVEPPDWLEEDERGRLVRPDGWTFFKQPPAVIEQVDPTTGRREWHLNPEAENLEHLPADYYLRLVSGRTEAYIRVQLACEYGSTERVAAVYRDFRAELHVEPGLAFDPGREIVLGIDYGRTPAAVICQRRPDGGWAVLDEVCATNIGALGFARQYLLPLLRQRYRDVPVVAFGDPAGEHLTQADETSPARVLRSCGIPVRAAPTQDPVLRLGAVERLLAQLVQGRPMLMVHPRCRTLVAGFKGGYRFKQTPDGRLVEPVKDRYSHVHDALQYAMVGMGEHAPLLDAPAFGGRRWHRPVVRIPRMGW